VNNGERERRRRGESPCANACEMGCLRREGKSKSPVHRKIEKYLYLFLN
jgi:hypothetical protein